MKAVKFFAWEMPYLDKITAARNTETEGIRRFRTVQTVTIALGRAAPALSACISLSTFALLQDGDSDEQAFTAANIFAAIAVFQSLRLSLIVIPHAFTSVGTIRVSMKRLEGYMLGTESKARVLQPTDSGVLLEMKDAVLAWPTDGTQKISAHSEVLAWGAHGPDSAKHRDPHCGIPR